MRVLHNEIVYQCEYCDKRFLSKQGVKRHENEFCYKSPIPRKLKNDLIERCNHNWIMSYETMLGEPHLLEPSGEHCMYCGVDRDNWEKNKWR